MDLLNIVHRKIHEIVADLGDKHILFVHNTNGGNRYKMILHTSNYSASEHYIEIYKNNNRLNTFKLESKQDIENIKRAVRIFGSYATIYSDENEVKVNILYQTTLTQAELWVKEETSIAQDYNFTEETKLKLVNLLDTIKSEELLDWNGKSIMKLLWLMNRYRLNGTNRLYKITEACQPKF